MSISSIFSSGLFSPQNFQAGQSSLRKLRQEFQQLGQDLQSGNLSQAQADFAALQPGNSQQSASAATQNTAGTIASAFKQLSSDLQAGNLPAAQQDYSNIQQDFQQQSSSSVASHHHHHHHPAPAQDSSGSQDPFSQLFSQLGQALQSGNLSAAQSAYTTLQQDFEQLGASAIAASPASNNSLSVSG